MTRNVQLSEPAAELLGVAERVTPGWLRRCVVATAARAGVSTDPWASEIDASAIHASGRLLEQLESLLALDVDEQRTNPLSLYRDAVAAPTAMLRAHDVPAPPTDAFADRHFPDDVYRLGPATWADIDPELHEPGLVWGAWKAMTVLQRRRDEGRR